MKDLMQQVKSFITFDFPVQTDYISAQFADTQIKLQTETPGWSTMATRQKLINSFWFTYVVGHFALILSLSVLIVALITGSFEQGHLIGIAMAGLLSFFILYLFHYRPVFGSLFLPRLETVKEIYEHKELKHLENCRKAQLPKATLILIHYAMGKASGMNALQANEQVAGLLMKLYGVDPQHLKKNMDLLLGSLTKWKALDGRARTEVFNRFKEAYQFFEELDFPKGVQLLKELEVKFM